MELQVIGFWNPGTKSHIGDGDNGFNTLCGASSVSADVKDVPVTLTWIKENNIPGLLCQTCATRAEKKIKESHKRIANNMGFLAEQLGKEFSGTWYECSNCNAANLSAEKCRGCKCTELAPRNQEDLITT